MAFTNKIECEICQLFLGRDSEWLLIKKYTKYEVKIYKMRSKNIQNTK